MLAIFKRELRAYFISPVGYVFMGIFLAIFGFYFSNVCVLGNVGTITGVLSGTVVAFLFLVPVLTMRLLSEERGNKTDQILLTSPVSVPSIVIGKYLAASAVFALTLAISLLHMGVLEKYGDPSWAESLGGYTGFLLMGLAFIAIGMFISSLTESQVVAAIGTFGALLILFLIGSLSFYVQVPLLKTIIEWLAITRWFDHFAMGIFSVPAIVYYLTIIAIFLFLTVRQIERRRWN